MADDARPGPRPRGQAYQQALADYAPVILAGVSSLACIRLARNRRRARRA
ncbi:hypothetical protein [Mycobacterium sp. AT1]|nr:hypothetical protein [Mycobacterium sp. AT1]